MAIKIGGITVIDDSRNLLNIINLPAGAEIIRVERTSNTILDGTNRSNLIDITSGTFTQTFTAAATLGSGWFCYIQNSGTGDITLDPNASETIDGLTSYIMYPGEIRLVQCDGSAFRTIVLKRFTRTFTASGTFTTPPGYSAFEGLMWGGGGSGGAGGTDGAQGTGGGGGGCTPFNISSSSFGTTESITIGSGGSAVVGSATPTLGNAGGNSTIGSLITAYGGGGGSGVGNGTRSGGSGGGLLGAGITGNLNSVRGGLPSDNTSSGFPINLGFGGGHSVISDTTTGADAVYGGGGGGTASVSIAYRAGNSMYGGGGGGATGNTGTNTGGSSTFGGAGGNGAPLLTWLNGTDGTAPAGAGGGTRSTGTSGAGARGELRIWGVI